MPGVVQFGNSFYNMVQLFYSRINLYLNYFEGPNFKLETLKRETNYISD